MRIVGYTDRWSVTPLESVSFKVSSELPSYTAGIVRLIHGDTNPEGPGFKEEVISTTIDGEYPGRIQVLRKGSYVEIPDSEPLRVTGSFTLQAWIYSTTPQKGIQGILTKWIQSSDAGYALVVGDRGASLWIGDGNHSGDRLEAGRPLESREWYFVCAGYDATTKRMWLRQEPLDKRKKGKSGAVVEKTAKGINVAQNHAPFLMAAYCEDADLNDNIVTGHFNGKIDGPSLFGSSLGAEDIEALLRGNSPGTIGGSLIATWDLGRGTSSTHVADISSHGLDGKTVNMPTRAMTGHNWKGEVHTYCSVPDEYGAIHFHDDDLEDAGWESDFTLTIPQNMKSGVYAAKLTSGQDEDYVPFFVRPPTGIPSASILFLAPTASYLAYANAQFFSDTDRFFNRGESSAELRRYQKDLLEPPPQIQDQYVVAQNLISLYDRHSDGSGVCHASRLRPMANIRPKYHLPRLKNVGSGVPYPHQLNADLHLIDWLEEKAHSYDVVTDEDLDREGAALLDPYKVVITGSHPEYWSGPMLDAVQHYLDNGGRVMYLGGNGFFWVTSFHPERPHVIEVRRWHGTRAWQAEPGEYYHATTGELGGLWRFRGRAPQRMLGVGFAAQGFDHSLPFIRQPASFDPSVSFIFEGIGDDEVIGDFGLVMEGAGGFEVDRVDRELGTPEETLVLATTSGFTDVYQLAVEEVLMNGPHGGTVDQNVRGDMTYLPLDGGGAVFSASSIAWCGSLSANGYDNNVSRITDNVLRRFIT